MAAKAKLMFLLHVVAWYIKDMGAKWKTSALVISIVKHFG